MVIQTHKLFQCVTVLFVGHLSHQCPAGFRGNRWICSHLGFEETHLTSVDSISLIRIVTWLHLGAIGYAASGQLLPRLYTKVCVCVCVHMCVCMHVHAQSCPTLCDPTDCCPPCSSVHGILQTRLLEWVTIPFSRESSWLRDWTQISFVAGGFFTIWATSQDIKHFTLPWKFFHTSLQLIYFPIFCPRQLFHCFDLHFDDDLWFWPFMYHL